MTYPALTYGRFSWIFIFTIDLHLQGIDTNNLITNTSGLKRIINSQIGNNYFATALRRSREITRLAIHIRTGIAFIPYSIIVICFITSNKSLAIHESIIAKLYATQVFLAKDCLQFIATRKHIIDIFYFTEIKVQKIKGCQGTASLEHLAQVCYIAGIQELDTLYRLQVLKVTKPSCGRFWTCIDERLIENDMSDITPFLRPTHVPVI